MYPFVVPPIYVWRFGWIAAYFREEPGVKLPARLSWLTFISREHSRSDIRRNLLVKTWLCRSEVSAHRHPDSPAVPHRLYLVFHCPRVVTSWTFDFRGVIHQKRFFYFWWREECDVAR